MELDYCCEAALGALLPDLDCGSQRWQSSSSFCDLEMAMTHSGSASWDVLLEDAADEEYSSKFLSQEFDLSQPINTIGTYEAFRHPATQTPTSAIDHQQPQCTSQACTPTCSAATSPSSLPSVQLSDDDAAAQSSSLLLDVAAALAVDPAAASRAGTPLQQQPASALEYADADTVRTAALALQLAQGDVSTAISQLLTWAAGR